MNAFTTTLNKYDFGKYFYTVVYFPQHVLDTLPLEQFPRLRLEAEIDGVFVEGALMPDKAGSAQTRHLRGEGLLEGQRVWYFLVSKKVLKAIGKALGDEVLVSFTVADQDAVDLPRALEELLEDHPRLCEAWDALSAGKKRSLVHPIKTAKTQATRARRLEELEILLLEG